MQVDCSGTVGCRERCLILLPICLHSKTAWLLTVQPLSTVHLLFPPSRVSHYFNKLLVQTSVLNPLSSSLGVTLPSVLQGKIEAIFQLPMFLISLFMIPAHRVLAPQWNGQINHGALFSIFSKAGTTESIQTLAPFLLSGAHTQISTETRQDTQSGTTHVCENMELFILDIRMLDGGHCTERGGERRDTGRRGWARGTLRTELKGTEPTCVH